MYLSTMGTIAYIGVGSNQGDRYTNCAAALESIAASGHTRLLDRSSFYLTEPWGYPEQDDFLNLVVKVDTLLTPFELLGFLQETEQKLARTRTVPFGPRTIDLDILFYNDHILQSPELTIPHARLCQRGFVLVPLREIAPHLVHPVNHRTIARLLDDLDDTCRVVKIAKEHP